MLEEHVTAVYLKAVGRLPYLREEVRVSNAGELALIESDIAEAVRKPVL